MKKKPTPREVTEKAIQRCVDNTDRVEIGWSTKIYAALLHYIARRRNQSFMTEDFRKFCIEICLPRPVSDRAFGGLVRRACKEGFIKRIGHAKVKNARAHQAFASVWVSTRY